MHSYILKNKSGLKKNTDLLIVRKHVYISRAGMFKQNAYIHTLLKKLILTFFGD